MIEQPDNTKPRDEFSDPRLGSSETADIGKFATITVTEPSIDPTITAAVDAIAERARSGEIFKTWKPSEPCTTIDVPALAGAVDSHELLDPVTVKFLKDISIPGLKVTGMIHDEVITEVDPTDSVSADAVEYHVEAIPDTEGNVQVTVPPHTGEVVRIFRKPAESDEYRVEPDQLGPDGDFNIMVPAHLGTAIVTLPPNTTNLVRYIDNEPAGAVDEAEPEPTPLTLELVRRQAEEIKKLWDALDTLTAAHANLLARIEQYNRRASHKL